MKRTILVVGLAVVLLLTAVLPASAQGNGPAPGSTCGRFFGQHVAEHAQAGHLGTEHNPGHHQGLANFGEHGDEHACP